MSDEPVLLQYKYGGDDELTPWRVLVITILLQRTRGSQVDDVCEAVFVNFPTPEALAGADKRLELLIKGCGLVNGRAKVLRNVSAEYEDWLWEHGDEGSPASTTIKQWKGVGDYTTEAYVRINEDWWDNTPEPKDPKLKVYWQWRNEKKTSPTSS